MIFKETKLKGVYSIELERREDERGFFARSFCGREFEEHGLNPCFAQCNISYNKMKGTLRGMHYQIAPYAEAKLVTCINGSIYDVIIDLRRDSPTYYQWIGMELTGDNYKMLYVPEGFAHGYQTLVDDTAVHYQVSEYYHPESEEGVRWDDPAFKIKWPLSSVIISAKDRSYKMRSAH